MRRAVIAATILAACVAAQAGTRADLSGDLVVDFATTMDMPFMTVGNPGNAGEMSGVAAGGYGLDRITGGVGYAYNIGKFEVTVGQYTEFLNAVAATDTYGLYNSEMWSNERGCKIQRSGSAGSYSYSVNFDRVDRPVNYVSWGDAARFSNWLSNGMPTGAQGPATTEGGSYTLNGAVTNAALLAVTRNAGPGYFIPLEDEWYKAAYYDGDADVYYDYPTGTDVDPDDSMFDPDPGNNACWNYNLDGPYYRSEVGEFENSASPYGTFDMGGNVWEWNETVAEPSEYGTRGGSYLSQLPAFEAKNRNVNSGPIFEHHKLGFRVAQVPEPATVGLLVFGAVGLLRRRRAGS